MTAEDPLLERIDQVLAEEMAFAMTTDPAPRIERTDVTSDRVAEYVRQLEEQLPEPLPKIKLTKDEWKWLKAANPSVDRAPSLLDIPVVLVDTPEESTLYRPPCCDRHSDDRCEMPTECCDACPRAVELRAFVAEYKRNQAVYHSRYWNYPSLAEPEPEPMRGWLARLFRRWSR